MSLETSKALRRRLRDPNFATKYFVGRAIDIGSGPDPLSRQLGYWPLLKSVDTWDLEDGEAQELRGVANDAYDLVYSSHCLEHLRDPIAALARWWQVLRPGGHLVVVVPDEDMYEQGSWPSTWNSDHKHTFTIAKRRSWSPVSHNMADLLSAFHFASIFKIERITEGFQFGADRFDQTAGMAECCIEAVVAKPQFDLKEPT
jgi:predicted SAM-dependent methyltransferase